MPYLPYKNIQ
ncbi:hypothetical protein FWK35_00019785 [Aphis craccivora]|uniref:Uncharacterized protein n=1 Tax=Aphis craccivora TaxID=307492 RepID=A0A6G0Y5U6_APHCR|nr:hypothetical protein FWK35_00019785 [Aphis craccivora]